MSRLSLPHSDNHCNAMSTTIGRLPTMIDGSWLASGVYFLRLTAGANAQTRKMILLK